MTERMIVNRVNKLQALEAQKAELEQQIEAIKDEIKKEMGEAERLEAGSHVIRWSVVVSSRFDGKAFKQDHPEMYALYAKQTQARRFSVV